MLKKSGLIRAGSSMYLSLLMLGNPAAAFAEGNDNSHLLKAFICVYC